MKLVPRTIPGKILGAIVAIVALLVVVAVAQGASKVDVASKSATVVTTPAAANVNTHTVRFVVTGTPADVTYGHGGTSTHGHVPMDKTESLVRTATVYSLTAVLSDTGGMVKVKIYIDGKLVAHAKATGAFQSADAIATKNPFTDQWEDGLGG